MEDAFVVLTVPHAVAPKSRRFTTHDSDTAAISAATAIRDALTKRNVPCTMLPAVVPRCLRDMNRQTARDSVWRREVDRLLVQRRKGRTILLDVHSYPGNYRDFRDADIVMLLQDGRQVGRFRSLLLTKLAERFRTGVIERPATMDIAAHAEAAMGVPSALLEFSEANDRAKVEGMADVLAAALQEYFLNDDGAGRLVLFPPVPYEELVQTDEGRRTCRWCRVNPSRYACERCLAAAYCSGECQRHDWTEGDHRQMCVKQ